MSLSCHRCGTAIPATDPAAEFCPHCGAPQLYLREHLLEDLPDTTNTPPPPTLTQIEWQPAIRAAAFVAIVAPALCFLGSIVGLFSLLGLLWIISGSVIAIGLYHQQRPRAHMDALIGARIGVVVGLSLSSALTFALAVSGLIARFGLHTMAGFDTEITVRFREQIAAMAAQATPTEPIPAWVIDTFLSPEFRAGIGLTSVAMLAAMVLIVSTLGGAFAGSLRTLPPPQPNP